MGKISVKDGLSGRERAGRLCTKLSCMRAPVTSVVKQVASSSNRCSQYRSFGGFATGFGSGWGDLSVDVGIGKSSGIALFGRSSRAIQYRGSSLMLLRPTILVANSLHQVAVTMALKGHSVRKTRPLRYIDIAGRSSRALFSRFPGVSHYPDPPNAGNSPV